MRHLHICLNFDNVQRIALIFRTILWGCVTFYYNVSFLSDVHFFFQIKSKCSMFNFQCFDEFFHLFQFFMSSQSKSLFIFSVLTRFFVCFPPDIVLLPFHEIFRAMKLKRLNKNRLPFSTNLKTKKKSWFAPLEKKITTVHKVDLLRNISLHQSKNLSE